MGARDEAMARDLAARARLAMDPIARVVMDRDHQPPKYRKSPRSGLLTPREIAVLRYLSRGLNNSDTAGALFIGVETVKTHLRSAKLKLRAKTTTHACCEAIRQGLIT